ncbi:hypothetical protein TSOC_004972 [Tetrabaena socialis]|uniref:Uncharacterized protein n=1 Tax=Tetrabaena socialis TaxID=47790 RepID=A0A2J8A7G7_9CHLO|nr:hypothetical protein TSOC_004972 [Tetrabaena socialis]|eukprot:PNH08445.1 hypothetical protein TSOC_004972 [Tetrabaena socialis]
MSSFYSPLFGPFYTLPPSACSLPSPPHTSG